MTELTSVRRSLFDLEAQHGRVRQQFEEEVTRMRAELIAIRQQQSTSNSNLSVGIPSLRSSALTKPSDPSSSFSSSSDQQQSQQGRPLTRDRPLSALDRDRSVDQLPQKTTRVERDERDVSERGVDAERLADPRDPKRHKARRDFSGMFFPSALICCLFSLTK
jgi:glucose repression regulatory protein TUP1